MKYARLWMVLAVALGGVLLFACGDDDDEPDTSPTAEQTSDGAEPTDGSEPTEDGSTASETDAELEELAGSYAEKPAKVAYTYTANAGGQESTGAFTFFWMPPATWRMDIEAEGTPAGTYISTAGTTYLCSSETCLESPVSSPLPFFSFLTEPGSLANLVSSGTSGVDFDSSEDEIAGQSVTCYTAAGSVEGQVGSAEYCFNDDGLLMRLDGGSAGATFTLEATSAETTVSEADFALPYPVQQIPGT